LEKQADLRTSILNIWDGLIELRYKLKGAVSE